MEGHLPMIDYDKLSCKISLTAPSGRVGWGRGCFPIGVLPRQNINVLIFDLVVGVVTEGVHPLLEYLCFRTLYHSLFEDLLLL
jgi:hypothetical protein